MNSDNSQLEVNVIETEDKQRLIALVLLDLNQMVIITPESARQLAFILMDNADFIQPPFSDDSPDSLACFGPYETSQPESEEDGDELQEEE